MKVVELEGAQLDYWVAKAEGRIPHSNALDGSLREGVLVNDEPFCPSSMWEHGGPIIERMTCDVFSISRDYGNRLDWYCGIFIGERLVFEGLTPLAAAMRAFVFSKFGEEVPDA